MRIALASVLVVLVGLTAVPVFADATPELQEAVTQVGHQVAYTSYVLKQNHQSQPTGLLVSLAAMNYVVGHVSAPSYGYDHELNDGAGMPVANAESVLESGAGICGHAALTFAAIVQQLGYHVRSVQFFYNGGNHIADEVFYNGAWHFFDPTWGIYFATKTGDAMSFTATGKTPMKYAVVDQSLLWTRVVRQSGLVRATGLGVYAMPGVRVVYDGQPF